MFENHVMQMFDTRELELRSRLGERRVDLVPPFRRHGDGLKVRFTRFLRSLGRRPKATVRRSTAPLHP
jgi:hypothetical protein